MANEYLIKQIFNCMVIDDEWASIQVIAKYINETPNLNLTCITTKPEEVPQLLEKHTIDLLFLDIHMKGKDGWDIKRMLDPAIHVVFCSADNRLGSEVFDVDGVDYLVKPFTFERFSKAIARVINRSNDHHIGSEVDDLDAVIAVKSGKMQQDIIELADIDYITTNLKRVQIHTINEVITVDNTLSELMQRLPSPRFIQISKSTIVPRNRIATLQAKCVVLKGRSKMVFAIGAKFKAKVQALYSQ
ncbi:LytTR family DNA-binding domain-containing protein [Olivibacter ginsenosidimutans]|uniref:LytTR family DNA-binding domain-containing protein n=1 Tax=Olivibacter ginsenosidimutans TaxID=1176537 RepID=A0ABP9AUQ3_9SPHI